jgi:thiamine pyrophosphokinase
LNNSPLNIVNIVGPLPLKRQIIDENLYSIVVDGGKNHQLPLKKCLSIGDQDSSHTEMDITLNKDKDASDLAFALKYIPKNTEIVRCYGLFGGRLDHQLCILGDICHYILDKKILFEFYSIDGKQLLIFPHGNWQISHKGIFSVLSLYEQAISLSGDIRFTLGTKQREVIYPLTSLTLSNEAFDHIEIQCEKPLALYLAI